MLPCLVLEQLKQEFKRMLRDKEDKAGELRDQIERLKQEVLPSSLPSFLPSFLTTAHLAIAERGAWPNHGIPA